MSEEGEAWKQYREEQKERRAERVPIRTAEILDLESEGFEIEIKTPFHFRINGILDVFPTHNRFHWIKKNKRGGCPNLSIYIFNNLTPIK